MGEEETGVCGGPVRGGQGSGPSGKGGVEGWKHHTTPFPHSPLQSCPLSSR